MLLSLTVITTKAQVHQLWGLTQLGGAHNKGAIIKINNDGSGFQNVYSFDSINGSQPIGSLLLASNGLLYGTSVVGGANNAGVIFSFDTASLTISVLHNCISINGYGSRTTLIQVNNGKLYGLAQGGVNNSGVLFCFDPSTNIYTDLYDFVGVNSSFRDNGLFQASNGLLYGMHYYGGANSSGYIFSFDLSNNTFTDIHDFTGADGKYPNAGLIQYSNGLLYGMTETGGSIGNSGVLFSIDPVSSSYSVLHNFDLSTGKNPEGNLLQVGNFLYGLTLTNINPSKGVLFRFDPSTNAYDTLYNFAIATGTEPYGSLIRASNGKLYGMTSNRGAHSLGVIFSFDLTTNIYTDMHDFTTADGNRPYGNLLEIIPSTVGIPVVKTESGVSIYPNPSSSVLCIHLSTPSSCQLLITDVLGNSISQHTLYAQDTKLDVSKWSNGIYFYEVRGSGLQIPTSTRGKFVVQH